MKKIILILTWLPLLPLYAQKENKFWCSIETGLVGSFTTKSGGASLTIEPKKKLTKNSNVGLRMRAGYFFGDNPFPRNSIIDPSWGYYRSYSFAIMVDRYFGSEIQKLQPFLGIGLGLFKRGDYSPDGPEFDEGTNFSLPIQPGAVLRTGFDVGKIKMVLDYNFISAASFVTARGSPLSITYNYCNLAIGFTIGGGKWRESAKHNN